MCSVRGCKWRASKSLPKPHLHPFPKPNASFLYITDESGTELHIDRKALWEKILLMRKPAEVYHRVCTHHFQKSDYERLSNGKFVLHDYAFPTINLPQYLEVLDETCMVPGCVPPKQHSKLYVLRSSGTNFNNQFHQWANALGRSSSPEEFKELVVCSRHFISGAPVKSPTHTDYVPTLNLAMEIEKVDVENVQEIPFMEMKGPELDPLRLDEEIAEPSEENWEDCIKVEPTQLIGDFENMQPWGEMEYVGLQDHEYCFQSRWNM